MDAGDIDIFDLGARRWVEDDDPECRGCSSAPSAVHLVFLCRTNLGAELAEDFQTLPIDLAALTRGLDRAPGLAAMAAVVEFTLAGLGPELDEGMLQIPRGQMLQAEFLHARRVDQRAVRVESVEARVCGGVPSGIERDRDITHSRGRIREERIDDGGLPHSD